MRRPLPLIVLLVGLAVPATVSRPLSAQVREAPVRYDEDHLSAAFHAERRNAVMERIAQDGLAVFFGAPVRNRSNDVSFEYRQQSDLFYLTGSAEPGSVLVLAPGGITVDGRTVRELLFVPPREPSQEVWLGRRFGTERAVEQLGLEMAAESTRFEEVMAPLLSGDAHRVFHLPLPDGVASGSDLEAQLALFERHVKPAEIPEAGLMGFMLHGVLASPSPQLFERLKLLAERGFEPSAASDPTVRSLAEAFVEADGYRLIKHGFKCVFGI